MGLLFLGVKCLTSCVSLTDKRTQFVHFAEEIIETLGSLTTQSMLLATTSLSTAESSSKYENIC